MLPGDEGDIDPRLAVLVVWGIFFAVFILLPSLCLRCAALCAGPNPRTDPSSHDDVAFAMGAAAFGTDDDYNDQFGWDRYMFLAAAKRRAIDEMRCAVVKRYVGRFSLALEEGRMVRRTAETVGAEDGGLGEGLAPGAGADGHVGDDGAGDAGVGTAPPLPMKGGVAKGQEAEVEAEAEAEAEVDVETEAEVDVETKAEAEAVVTLPREAPVPSEGRTSPGLGALAAGPPQAAVADPLAWLLSRENEARRAREAEAEVEAEEEEESTYTHVRLPLPGHDSDGVRPPAKRAPAGAGEERSRRRRRPWWLRLFAPQAPAVEVPEAGRDVAPKEKKEKEEKEGPDAVAGVPGRDARRDVPAFCAICLGEYAPSDVVSWSSNPACTHVFHQDCICQWLQTLGRKTCKYQRFTDAPTVGMVLNYGLECPCCRQDFILKELAIEEERGTEEAATGAVRSAEEDNV